MTQPDLDGVSQVLRKVTGRDIMLTDDTEIARDMGLDSLETANLVMALEDAYDVTIPLSRVEDLRTAGDIVRALREMEAH